MRFYGLSPDAVLARSPAAEIRAAPSLPFSIVYGAVSFAVVSVIAYSIWAFQLIRGTAAMYTSIAAIYVGLTGIALSRLVPGRGATPRFALLFATGFVVYAIAWCAFWFGLRGKYVADLWGAAVGLAALTLIMQRAFGVHQGFLASFAVLFTFHTFGYTLGENLYGVVRGSGGRLLWGAAHGCGFGAGLGYVLFHCQAPVRARLLSPFAELTPSH